MAGLQSSVEDRAQGAAAEAALMAGQVAALQEALKVGHEWHRSGGPKGGDQSLVMRLIRSLRQDDSGRRVMRI
eukprot:scaffold135551_cov20-Tisochrysis_lutea.AAC.2